MQETFHGHLERRHACRDNAKENLKHAPHAHHDSAGYQIPRKSRFRDPHSVCGNDSGKETHRHEAADEDAFAGRMVETANKVDGEEGRSG